MDECDKNIATLIDLNFDDDDDGDKIYVDFMSHELGTIPPVQQLLWGDYIMKPKAQTAWDKNVRKACQEIAATQDLGDHDFQPRVKDLNTGMFMLIDTGASVSVFPRTHSPTAQFDPHTGLKAINGTKIATYGTKSVKIRLD